MIRLTFLLALTSFLSLQAFAQHTHDRGVCGTPEIDIERTKANIAYAKTNPLQSRMTTYIPVRFHLFGLTNETNAVSPNSLLDLMAAVNVDFAPYDFKFFLEDGDGTPWDYTYNNDLYNTHADFQPFLRNEKRANANAMTIFVPNTATPPNSNNLGTTLGYYSPQPNDYLVFKKSEVSSNASTASHEIGHYFSLPHTFRGWDCTSWDGNTNTFVTSPVMETTAPCFNVPVELVSRGSDGNCATAGDLFCDTPADYNLGFGWSNCDYTGDVQDATSTPLRPDESNYMGYFLGCNPYTFTPEQVATMNADLASNGRSFLRGFTPSNIDPITESVVLVSPLDETRTEFSDQVMLDWEPVPNAKYYYVEVSERSSMRSGSLLTDAIVTSSSFLLTGLEADETYYYRVRAFSQSSFGEYGAVTEFRTGRFTSSLAALPGAVESMVVFPNPTSANGESTLKMESAIDGEITLVVRDLTGRTVSSSIERIVVGDNVLNISSLIPSTKGTYTLSASNAKGLSSQKFNVF